MVACFGILPGSVASPCLNFTQMGTGGSRAPLGPASDTPYGSSREVLQSFRLSPSCDGAGSRDLQNFKPTASFVEDIRCSRTISVPRINR
jgi:hypothetical protein